jgi:MoxR-like ATPase
VHFSSWCSGGRLYKNTLSSFYEKQCQDFLMTFTRSSVPVSSLVSSTSVSVALEDIETVVRMLQSAQERLQSVIFGQEDVIRLSLITVLSGGHGLLVGLPGLAKTKLVETLGIVLGLETKRVQFTPDLMPGDILGSEVLEEDADKKRHFRFIKGPVFAQLLMADEINRASPRTQSALLQAMQEQHVSVGGERHQLPHPFHVLATQNPIEQEGTYPLPEAQLDRFLMQIDVTYPTRVAEKQMLLETTGVPHVSVLPAMSAADLIHAQHLIRRMPIGESVVDAILDLVQAARPSSTQTDLAWGAGPRAGQAMMLACRARALLDGRLSPSIEDVAALARPILKHRMALTYKARAEGLDIDTVIARLLSRLMS